MADLSVARGKTLPVRFYGTLAVCSLRIMVVHLTLNQGGTGSNPVASTICSCGAIWKTRYLEVVDVVGSSPIKSTNNMWPWRKRYAGGLKPPDGS